jgi:exodeoxyribonuclease V gamma subunit
MDLVVLEAVGGTTDVHLFLLHPSPVLWRDTAPLISEMAEPLPRIDRIDDPGQLAANHPFLASWAQESRELQVMLGSRGERLEDVRALDGREPTSLLGELQADIRANREPSVERNPTISERVADGADRSIQIHSCHGAQRQVEVLRDALLHILSDDPTLEPRDIVVMTPDLETFAPLIDAAFPASSSEDGALPDLRVRIADRAPSRTNPLVRFAGTILELAGSRLGTGAVAQLVALPEVQRRLGMDIDTTADIGRLMDDANIRWGLDADHRERNGAGPRDEHTWRRGIDRVLTGVFFDDNPIRTVGDVAPLTGMEGESAASGGDLALVIERLGSVAELLGTPEPVSRWADKIATAVRLLAAPARDGEWQWAQLDRLLDETFPQEVPGTPDPVIGLREASVLVAPWTNDIPSRLHHRTGNVTVCSLAPMRSVPYRVVCLVGMEHDRFPRSSRHDGDDLLVDDEVIGDRDRAAEDRQLLLDALMAAGDHFLVTYSGRNPLSNAAYPPAVPIAELLETVAAMVGEQGVAGIMTEHPLQPFSPDVFTGGKLGVPGPWGFDPIQRAGAAAVSDRAVEPDMGVALAIDTISVETPTLDQLIAYLKAPSLTFLRHSFGMFIPNMDDPLDDELPTGLNALEQWGVTNRLLAGIRNGHNVDRLVAHERATDAVPAGELATGALDDALDLALRIATVAEDRGCTTDSFVPVTGTVTIAGEAISGSVVADIGGALVCDVSPSRDKPTRRTALYAQVAFLTALDPERAWRGVMVGRGDNDTVAVVTIGPFSETPQERSAEATRRLEVLVALYHEGMAVPLPIFPESSHAWQAAEPDRRYARTGDKWEPGWYTAGERDEPAHRMLFGDLVTVADLAGSEFPLYAERLWAPILDASTEETA